MDFLKLFLATLLILVAFAVLFVTGFGYFTFPHSDPQFNNMKLIFLTTLIVSLLVLSYVIIKFIANKYYVSKNHQLGELTLKEWLYDLIPFRPINILINQVYPQERVINKRFCYDTTFMFGTAGGFPVIFRLNINFPFPATLVETDKSYYVDRRLQNFLNKIILLGVTYFILSARFPLFFVLFGITVFVTFYILPILFWQVVEIRPVYKSWLTQKEIKGKTLTLTGTSPANAPFYLSSGKLFNKVGATVFFKLVFILL